MFKKTILLALCLMPGINAVAACPDIDGRWVLAYSGVVSGEESVGVFRLTVTPTRINASGIFSYVGQSGRDAFSTNYIYNSSCKLAFTLDGTIRFEGFAINPDKIALTASDTGLGESYLMIAERFDDGI